MQGLQSFLSILYFWALTLMISPLLSDQRFPPRIRILSLCHFSSVSKYFIILHSFVLFPGFCPDQALSRLLVVVLPVTLLSLEKNAS
jgi:hypothetical protein